MNVVMTMVLFGQCANSSGGAAGTADLRCFFMFILAKRVAR